MADSLLDLDGEAILTQAIDWSSLPSLSDSFGRDVIQSNFGKADYRSLTRDLNYLFQYVFGLSSKADIYELVDFFHKRQGRFERFWIPIYFQMFTLAAAIVNGSSQFQISDQSQYKTLHLYERLFIKMKNGDLVTRAINSLAVSPDVFTVTSAWDRDVALSDVRYFGRLALVRFDQDELELKYETDSVAVCTLQFKELAKEYDLAYGGS